jgi:hypothetical protein
MVRLLRGLAPLALAAAMTMAGAGGALAQGSDAANDAATAGQSPLIIRVVDLNTWYRAALVEREATRNPKDLEALARPICEGLTVCRVGIWIDQWTMPNAMPVRAPQLEAQEYAFGRNAKGEETSLWNCNKYPEFEAEQACLPRVLK